VPVKIVVSAMATWLRHAGRLVPDHGVDLMQNSGNNGTKIGHCIASVLVSVQQARARHSLTYPRPPT
jgi:hypothetical protein